MPEHLKTAKHTRLLNSERCFKCKKMVLREKMTRYNDAYICPCINKKKKKAGRPKGSKNKKKKPVDVKLDVEEPAKVLHGASK